VQNEPITSAVQPTLVIRAPVVIVDLIAVTDVEAEVSAVPPNRVLNEPGKYLRERRIKPAGVDGLGYEEENVCASAGPVAARAVRVTRSQSSEDSGSVKEIVHQRVDDNETRAHFKPSWPVCPDAHQQRRQRHRNHLVGDPIDIPERVNQGGSRSGEVGRSGLH
jgi:hypothetical protein